MELDFIFKSPDHIRYENGKHVSGPHGEANRAIKVEPNIYGSEGFTVTLYNLDRNHDLSQNNIQMEPKQMNINYQDNEKIVLRGFGVDAMGNSFSDYGLTIYFNNGIVDRCILHMHDRNVDIEYLKDENSKTSNEPEIVTIAKRVNRQYQQENVTDGRDLLIQIYRSVKSNPEQLKFVTDYSSLGTSFLLMITENLTDDIDILQMITSVGYLCISKAIKNDSDNINLYKDRILLLRFGHKPFSYTVMSALDIDASPFSIMGSMSSISARDEIYKMEIADLESNPQLYYEVPFFRNMKKEFDGMIQRQSFAPDDTIEEVINSGIENHNTLLAYLEDRILDEEDIDF